MKKTIYLLMLLTSITVTLFAQSASKSDKIFETPASAIFNRRFVIDLDKRNQFQIELADIADLDRLSNIDSLLQVFLTDVADLKDSLADPLTSKRIDYLTDAQGRKKIRFQQFQPKGASFLLNDGELASLRTEQDTIHIIGVLVNPPPSRDKTSRSNPRYYHLTFYLNTINELPGYMKGA
ncbi:MAG: hypothetical protein ABIQ31_15085, partial [Ferruginibacter sp.]